MKKILIILILFLLFFVKLPKNINDINLIQIYDDNNNLIYEEVNDISNSKASFNELNESTLKALLYMEDQMFFRHHGFNIYRTFNCFFNNILKNQRKGASTITQQLSKNLFLNNKKTITRKLLELRYSINLELKYNKTEILEKYLNIIYFSNNIYGIKDACRIYFKKDVSKLSLNEAICLFLISKSPSKNNPYTNKDSLIKGKDYILKMMLKNNIISYLEYRSNLGNVIFYKNKDIINPSLAYFIYQVKNELKSISYKKPIKIYTSFNNNLSNYLNNLKLNNLEHAIIITNKTGDIISIIGGNDYEESINHIHTKRTIASLIKPFICYNALTHGESPYKNINTSKRDFYFNNEIYSPSNYNEKYKDYSNMAYNLSTSSNIYSCIMTQKYNNTLEGALKKAGITYNNYLSLALGSTSNSLFDMVKAYSLFFNDGSILDISCINKIYDLDNNLIYIKNKPIKVYNTECVKCIKSILNLCFDNNIDYSTLKSINNPYTKNTMAKTGTDDYNSWVIGFSDNYLLGIWEGYDKELKIDKSDAKELYKAIFSYLKDSSSFECNKRVKIYNNYTKEIYIPNILPKIKTLYVK